MTVVYTAQWVLPISSPPIANGAVAIEHDKIVGVASRKMIEDRFPSAGLHELGQAVILPGLINVHSHLELTALRGLLEAEEGNFFAWLRKLTQARLERMTEQDHYVSAAWGACEAARAGITCVGDAGDSAYHNMRALRDTGLRGIAYQESFGPDPKLAEDNVAALRTKVSRLRELESPLVRVGVSPHAPYTVCAAQLEMISELALSEDLPVMMHAAESLMEEMFMREGCGPFSEIMAQRGIRWNTPHMSTIQYLKKHGVLRTKPLLAHCINVDGDDIDTLREFGVAVAHCPKSNAKLGHGRAPFETFIRNDVVVGLGSDSVASNNTCDIIEEARFALLCSRAPGDSTTEDGRLEAAEALSAATLGGARALGLSNVVGELREGLQADLTAISLSGGHQIPSYNPVTTLVFSSSGRDVKLTVVAGRELFRDGRVVTIDEQDLRSRVQELASRLAL